jgi:hypothetical protein
VQFKDGVVAGGFGQGRPPCPCNRSEPRDPEPAIVVLDRMS